jgi:hypothetical protein
MNDWQRYLDLGWQLTPIRPGTKKPRGDGWMNGAVAIRSKADLPRLNGAAGVLLVPSGLMTLDVDDIKLATQYLMDHHNCDLTQWLGAIDAVGIDSGQDNKAKLVFKLAQPMRHIKIRQDGNIILEFRSQSATGGSCQDLLPPSPHPNGGHYEWIGEPEDVELLPQIFKNIWQAEIDKKFASAPAPASLDKVELPDNLNEDGIKRLLTALNFIPIVDTDYETWTNIGFGLHHAFSNTTDPECNVDVGLGLYQYWSSEDTRTKPNGELYYNQAATAAKWQSFNIRPGGITEAYIFKLAQGYGFETQPQFGELPDGYEAETTESAAKVEATGLEPVIATPDNYKGLPLDKVILLPGDGVTYPESAKSIFRAAKRSGFLYLYNDKVVRLRNGKLRDVTSSQLTSMVDAIGAAVDCRVGGLRTITTNEGKEVVFASKRLFGTTAGSILDDESRDELDEIEIFSATPFVASDGSIIGKGYNAEHKVYVTNGEVEDVPFEEAVDSIKYLLKDMAPFRPADLSRAVAMMLSPAFKPGHLIDDHYPIHLVEAHEPQSGKGTYAEAAILIYGEEPKLLAQPSKRGVGTIEEAVGTALANTRRYIVFDNVRGKFHVELLEVLLTGRKSSGEVRPAYSTYVQVDQTLANFYMTSNGVDMSVDLANRSNIVKIRKQPVEYQMEFDTKEAFQTHIEDNRSYYLGCVLAIVQRWIADGKPKTNTTGHNFKGWARVMDHIVTEYFGLAPLTEGLAEAKLLTSDRNLQWLRRVCIHLERDGQLDEWISASELAEALGSSTNDANILPNGSDLCDAPGKAHQRLGTVMRSKAFRGGNPGSFKYRTEMPVEEYLFHFNSDVDPSEDEKWSHTYKVTKPGSSASPDALPF